MNNVINERDKGPWYREPWPWILMAIPASSVVLGFVMLSLALSTNNSLVADDYYKQGKAINQRIERDKAANALGVVVTLLRERDDGLSLQVSLPESASLEQHGQAMPAEFRLRWSHVTQAERDGEARLVPMGQGSYRSVENAALPESGRYRLHLEPSGDAWRLVSPVVRMEDIGSVRIAPRDAAVPGVTS